MYNGEAFVHVHVIHDETLPYIVCYKSDILILRDREGVNALEIIFHFIKPFVF